MILRLYAPNANEVKVAGDWLRRGESPTPLEKGADGVWSVTIGPLPPAVYGYAFLVDGVRASDPANPRAVLAAGRSASSLIEVRGIAGLSLGGELALTVGLRHPETFRCVASLSGSLFEKDFPDRFNAFLEHPTPPKLLWIGCGAGDLFLPGAKKLSEILTAKGVKHTFREIEGYHTWLVWRPYLAEILPLLFR